MLGETSLQGTASVRGVSVLFSIEIRPLEDSVISKVHADVRGPLPPVVSASPSSAPESNWTVPATGPSGETRPATLPRRASQSSANGFNQYFIPPPSPSKILVMPGQIQVERYTPDPTATRQPRQQTISLAEQAPMPVNQPWSLARQTSLPLLAVQDPAKQAIVKRKLSVSGLAGDVLDVLEIPDLSNVHKGMFQQDDRGKSSTPVIKREASQEKPSIPIPILPIPLPSKRFKKNPGSRAVLIPVEQLPVFALPPLPTIDDADLVKKVFTHQSLSVKVRGQFEEPIDYPARHYEKLEHVGDSILGMIVTTWLHETRPRLTCGSATVS